MDRLSGGRLRQRRMQWIGLLAIAALLWPVAAHAARSGVVVFCDRTLVPVMQQLASRFGPAPVSVFATSPPLMLAQIAHAAQNDVLVTSEPMLDEAARQGLIRPQTRIGSWRNGVVLAAPAAAGLAGADPAGLLTGRSIAVTDATTMATFDGQALLRRLGLPAVTADHVLGAANTNEVRALLDSGAVQLGLVYRTDVQADPGLAVITPVPGGPDMRYGAALSKVSDSSNARGFLDFLQTPAATALWRGAGLDVQ